MKKRAEIVTIKIKSDPYTNREKIYVPSVASRGADTPSEIFTF